MPFSVLCVITITCHSSYCMRKLIRFASGFLLSCCCTRSVHFESTLWLFKPSIFFDIRTQRNQLWAAVLFCVQLKLLFCSKVKRSLQDTDDFNFQAFDIFTYLGSILENGNETWIETPQRIRTANRAHSADNKHFGSKILPRNIKLKILKAALRSVLTYSQRIRRKGCKKNLWSDT